MPTNTQLQSWCTDHGYIQASLVQTTSVTQHMFNALNWTKIGLWTAGIVAAYWVGRVGIPAAWTALKSDYSSIRNYFSGTKTTTPVATVTPVATPVAVS